jgi:CBS-domain-containing membrane protein
VALLLTTALMLLFKVSHPAAGATALLIGLGIVIAPSEWLELLGAVVAICALGIVVNRVAGIAYPLWSPLVRVLPAGRTLGGHPSRGQHFGFTRRALRPAFLG